MRWVGIRRRLLCATVVLGGGVLLSASASRGPLPRSARSATDQIALAVDPGESKVHWTLGSTLHTVHGTFALKRGELQLESATGKAAGEIVVDAASGQSGNDSRDNRMHKEILESARYNELIFRPDHVEGKLQESGVSTVQVHGTFVLHGKEHELTVPVQAELAAEHWKGTAKFGVPYIQWGLKNPSNFLLKVDPTVDVELELAGSVK